MLPNRSFVVVIDDSATIRNIVADMLTAHGYQSLAAETVELALRDLGRKDFDIAIVDIFMPGMGGIEGIRAIKDTWPEVKIVAISAGHAGMDRKKTLRAAALQGADRTLEKPFTEEELIGAVEELLAQAESEKQAPDGDENEAAAL